MSTSANPQIADSSFFFGFANLISYRKYLRICGEKLKFTANPQSNRPCAWKKWRLLFSGLEVNVRELMTFFFWRSTSGRWQNLTFKNKKGHHKDKITVNNVVSVCGSAMCISGCGSVKSHRKPIASLRICGCGTPFAVLRNLRLRN